METSIYLGGHFTESPEKKAIINPYNGETVAECAQATPEHVQQAVDAALAVKTKLATLPAYERYAILKSISEKMTARKYEMARLISLESGKPMKYATGEVERAADTFMIAAEESKRLPKEYISLDWTPVGKNRQGLVNYFPAGIVAGISPFNFPINLVAHKIAPAIAAGCPIILKPSSVTPLTALMLARLIDETSLPKGAVSILPCSRKTGDVLVTHEDINVLSFTGSPGVGWEMKAKAGKKKVILELGGNAAIYVHSDADIAHAVKRSLTGGFAYSGQVCIHAQRIYVHAGVYDVFTQQFIAAVKQLKEGNPLEESTEVSAMIDAKNAERVESWINESVADGASVLCGGRRKGNFVEPTVLTNTTAGQKVNSEEIFGPVVCLEKTGSAEEAIQRINDSRYGLQAGIFTNDHHLIQKAFNEIAVGGLIVNDAPTFRVDHMPYGGIKDSGLGREGVAYTIREFMEPRILVY